MKVIKGKDVLITGAGRGIGRAFVDEFLQAGAQRIYMGIRRLETVIGLVAYAPRRLIPIQLDVTNMDHIRAAVQRAANVSIVVNNAGVLHKGRLFDRDRLKAARHEMEVNYFGTLAMTHAFAPVLARNGGGTIVNVASVAGLVAMPGLSTFSTSKAAVHFLTLESRMELAAQGTRVIGVYPGPVDSYMARSFDFPKLSPKTVAQKTLQAIQEGRDSVFPDPNLHDIYTILRQGTLVRRKMVDDLMGQKNGKPKAA